MPFWRFLIFKNKFTKHFQLKWLKKEINCYWVVTLVVDHSSIMHLSRGNAMLWKYSTPMHTTQSMDPMFRWHHHNKKETTGETAWNYLHIFKGIKFIRENNTIVPFLDSSAEAVTANYKHKATIKPFTLSVLLLK